MRRDWPLDPNVVYLNHGTVGVTPNSVLAAQEAIRHEVERGPSQFMLREQFRFAGAPTGRPTRVRQAADEVAPFVGARGQDFVFVDNATTGVNAVLRSLPLAPGDEILLTNHNYGATLRVAQFVARERGASVRVAEVPYPTFDAQVLVDSVRKALTPRTRVAVLDHVTSESALVFPLTELVRLCRDRGVPVLVDAAHAPGMLPIDLSTLGVDWYTANPHKWACSPRSCGFLWAAPHRQAELHPPVISWGLDQGFAAEFDWTGTRDVSAWLAAPEGWRFLERLGRDAVWTHNHGWHCRARGSCGTLGHDAGVSRESDIDHGDGRHAIRRGSQTADAMRVRDAPLFEHHIEVQVHAARPRLGAISARSTTRSATSNGWPRRWRR